MNNLLKTIFIALGLISCNVVHKKNRTLSTIPIDTVKTSTGIIASPTLFESAFIKGTTEKIDTALFNFYGVNVGNLKVTSGLITICDPLHVDEYGIPFTQAFPTGEFPVQVSVANRAAGELIAFARIYFSDEPVAKWEFALLKGQETLPVGGVKSHGFSVDAGIGIFMDRDAANAWNKSDTDSLQRKLFNDLDAHYHNDWKYSLYNFGQHNAAAFTTGVGDGTYSTYIGFDAAGKPCRLLADFGIFDWRGK